MHTERECPLCGGEKVLEPKSIYGPLPCPKCNGTGHITIPWPGSLKEDGE